MNKNWLVVILIVSISINLLLVGVFIGRAMFGPPDRPPLDWATTEITDDTRRVIREKMREHRAESLPLRRDFREAQRELRQALEQEPYNPESVDAAFNQLRQTTGAMQSSMHEHMSEVLSELSPDERIKIYRALSHPRGPGRPRHSEEHSGG